MFVLSVDLRIKPENVESFLAKAVENAAHSRKDPGCRQFDCSSTRKTGRK